MLPKTLYIYDGTGLYLSQIVYPNNSNENFKHDPSTGLLLSSIDVNIHTTSYTYDSMRRLTHVLYPDTGWESYCFIDIAGQACPGPAGTLSLGLPAFVFQKALAVNPASSYSSTLFEAGLADGLGRLTEKQLLSDGPTVGTTLVTDYTDTTYDALGRVQSISNPYRVTGSAATNGITSYSYDALGRKTYQCQPDNGNTPSNVCIPGNSYQQWSYNQNKVTFWDELRNSWTRTSDALGRLTSVLEPSRTSLINTQGL